MKIPLIVACVGEAITGLVLLFQPGLVVRLLFGVEISGVGVIASRIAGMALIALGVACWPGGAAHRGMLAYSVLATAYLLSLGLLGEWDGPLLWPAVTAHAVLTLLLARTLFTARLPRENHEK